MNEVLMIGPLRAETPLYLAPGKASVNRTQCGCPGSTPGETEIEVLLARGFRRPTIPSTVIQVIMNLSWSDGRRGGRALRY